MIALVEPPRASSTRNAFSTDCCVMIWLGRSGFRASSAASVPVASPARSRSACTAGIAAVPGSDIPSASAMQAMVDAVPITAQVPAVTARLFSISPISSDVISPARYFAQKRRRHGLVAAAHQHHRVHGLGADHLLRIHRHEVAEHEARWVEEDLAER